MKVLIVDDERFSSRKLERSLKKFDRGIEIVAAIPSLTDSFDWLKNNKSPDLILVNKAMLRGRTNNLVAAYGLEATVIFSLQHDQYSFSAFRTENLNLLKGITTLHTPPKKEPARKTSDASVAAHAIASIDERFRKRFLVKHGPRYVSVETTDIAYFFSFERFVYFKTQSNQKYLVEYSLEELEEMLNPESFFRVNRSVFLAFKAISSIHPYSGNRLKLHLNPAYEKEIIVSRDKIHEFKDWLGR